MAEDKFRPDRPSRRRDEEFEEEDDRPRRRRRVRDEEDEDDDYPDVRKRNDGGLNTLIPYRNPTALTGYYVGVFSLIPCFALILGPAAIVLGSMGMRYRKKNPTAGGMAHAIVALVLGSITSLANWGCVISLIVVALMKK
jgi:hypothetical protein